MEEEEVLSFADSIVASAFAVIRLFCSQNPLNHCRNDPQTEFEKFQETMASAERRSRSKPQDQQDSAGSECFIFGMTTLLRGHAMTRPISQKRSSQGNILTYRRVPVK